MKKTVILLLLVFLVTACTKPKIAPPPVTPGPSHAVSDKKDAVTSSKAEDKSTLEELEGLKKLTPEDISPDMVAKAQMTQSDVAEETGVLGKKIYFDFDSYELKSESRDILQELANYLKEYKPLNIIMEGHCDERGTREYNLALGMKRAEAAKKYLSDLGTDENRLDIISYGKDKPAVSGAGEDAWSKNRRVQFKRVP